jgi:hypothetical protein
MTVRHQLDRLRMAYSVHRSNAATPEPTSVPGDIHRATPFSIAVFFKFLLDGRIEFY